MPRAGTINVRPDHRGQCDRRQPLRLQSKMVTNELPTRKGQRPKRYEIVDCRRQAVVARLASPLRSRRHAARCRWQEGRSGHVLRRYSHGWESTRQDGHWRFTLNGKTIFHWGPLDQGWWPDGLLTPPSDEAMLFDIEYLKGGRVQYDPQAHQSRTTPLLLSL